MVNEVQEYTVVRQPIYTRALLVDGYELVFAKKGELVDFPMTLAVSGIEPLAGGHNLYLSVPLDQIKEIANLDYNNRIVYMTDDLSYAAFYNVLETIDKPLRVCMVWPIKSILTHIEKPCFCVKIDAHTQQSLFPMFKQAVGNNVIVYSPNSAEALEVCRTFGFANFSGRFYRTKLKPSVVPSTTVDLLNLVARINKGDITINELEQTISRNVDLSYRLLRFLNTAQINCKVNSVRRALIMLGMPKILEWATMLAFSSLGNGLPDMPQNAVLRGKMCTAIANTKFNSFENESYLVGLFSMLDEITNTPMETLLKRLPLDSIIKDALLTHSGTCGKILETVLAHTHGDFSKVSKLGIVRPEEISSMFIEMLSHTTRN